MHELTSEGLTLVEQVAQRHNVSTDAVLTLLRALDRGGGMQAQFSHPELGGMGQWSRGGMIMVGDMFNNGLKARVDQLCNELSEALGTRTLFTPAERGHGWGGAWWPPEFGAPSSNGSQNDMSYACFPDTRRLAIRSNGAVRFYDTGDHRIGGMSQQQSGSQDLIFTSQYGTVRLHELAPVGSEAPGQAAYEPAPSYSAPGPHGQMATYEAPRPWTDTYSSVPDDDVFGKIERLHELQRKGVLSEAEFTEKKKELLARI